MVTSRKIAIFVDASNMLGGFSEQMRQLYGDKNGWFKQADLDQVAQIITDVVDARLGRSIDVEISTRIYSAYQQHLEQFYYGEEGVVLVEGQVSRITTTCSSCGASAVRSREKAVDTALAFHVGYEVADPHGADVIAICGVDADYIPVFSGALRGNKTLVIGYWGKQSMSPLVRDFLTNPSPQIIAVDLWEKVGEFLGAVTLSNIDSDPIMVGIDEFIVYKRLLDSLRQSDFKRGHRTSVDMKRFVSFYDSLSETERISADALFRERILERSKSNVLLRKTLGGLLVGPFH